MCGIVGMVSAGRPVDAEAVTKMATALAHRGPDDHGTWISEDRQVGLGHRRLAIIDLSPLGHQPMHSAEGDLVVVFNGEIYNFRDVRAELEARGHVFRSSGDTEVLLAAYKVWGVNCLSRLAGMFSFALWDARARRLFVARDRAGEKPLFYRHEKDRFVFASELKGILTDRNIERSINHEALEDYLTYGYVSGATCLLNGFAKLPAAHWLIYTPDTDRVQIERYWHLPVPAAGPTRAADELVDELEALLVQSVRGQLVADVPVGILLSGGLDSSLVAAAAARASGRAIKTFNVAFPDHPAYDESPYARGVAAFLRSDHTELVGEATSGELLPELIRQYDEPIADSSMIPTYLVSRAVRQECTVALGGDGGDELFGGYAHHPWFLRLNTMRQFGLHRLRLESLFAKLVPMGVKGRSAVIGLLARDAPQVVLTRLLDPESRARLTGRAVSLAPELRRAGLDGGRTGIDGICATDFLAYMCDDILVKVDRASMLTSLEVRAPLLDHRIIEFAFGQVPASLKVEGDRRKIILRQLAARWLPPAFDSHRKQGFGIPIHAWFQGPWKSLVDDLSESGSPIFDKAALTAMVQTLRSSERGSHRLFQLLALELWRREYRVSA